MRQLLSRIRWKNVALFVAFLLLATFVWYVHAMQSMRDTHLTVKVEYIKPGNIGLGEKGLPDQIQIDVRDVGHVLETYYRTPLHLTIDLRPYIHGTEGTIQIPSNAIRSNIAALLQGTSRLLGTYPEEITCPYFVEQEKTVTLVYNTSIQPAEGFRLLPVSDLTQAHIQIYGQTEQLDAIDTVFTERFERQEVKEDIHEQLALRLPDGIRAEPDSVALDILTEQFTEKCFLMRVEAKEVQDGRAIRLEPDFTEVHVLVGVSHYKEVTEDRLHVFCSCPPSQDSGIVRLQLDYTENPYIIDAWTNPESVVFYLEK